jgi:ammonium transporter, Amt family
MLTTWVKHKKPDVSMTLNGALAGLVAITAGCASVTVGGALVIGVIAGILIVYAVEFLDKVLKIDDPVGAVSVHGVCGVFGTIMVGLFAVDGGLFYGGGSTLLGIQVLGVASVLAWVAVTAAILFGILKATGHLRVSRDEEYRGLDIEEHGVDAYADFVPR